MKTQLDIVKDKLLDDGSISRNWCLHNYLSRLSARIKDLKDDGWEIEGGSVKTSNGRDYVYRLIKAPIKKVGLYVGGELKGVKYERVV